MTCIFAQVDDRLRAKIDTDEIVVDGVDTGLRCIDVTVVLIDIDVGVKINSKKCKKTQIDTNTEVRYPLWGNLTE
ncbi:unnamed protein product [[Candida] boidinii]|nr:unnamed protein product [[Candida] boidinii]